MKLALGTAQFGMDYGISSPGTMISHNEAFNIINYSRQCGINFLDTAPSYGNSEEVIGSLGLKDFSVVTKSRHFHQETLGKNEKNLLLSDFNNSLEILNLRKIYGVLVHNSIDLFKTGSQEIYDGLLWLKKNGFVDKIGVSVYTNDQLKRIIDNYDIDMVQLPFNIFDKRLVHSGMLNLLNKKNIEVHVRSVFLQGLLLIPAKKLPVKFNQWKSLWVFWNEWLKDNNLTALEASVRYALSKNEISKVIVGVHSKKHLHEIILASSGHLPDIPNNLYTNDINLLNPSNW